MSPESTRQTSAELYTFCDVVGMRAELAPMGQRLADGFGAPNMTGGQVGGFESQCVVFVFGDVFFVGRRFMGCPHCLFGLQQVFGEPIQYLLLQQEFIHEKGGHLKQAGSGLEYEGHLPRPTFGALAAASARVIRDFLISAADHPTRTWVIADHVVDPRLPWKRQIDLDPSPD